MMLTKIEVKLWCVVQQVTRAGYTSESGLGSSVNGSSRAGSVKMDCGFSEMTDFGLSSEIQDTTSTSSNEDEDISRWISPTISQ